MISTVLDGRYKITQNLRPGGFGKTFLAEDIKRPGNPICVVKQLNFSSSNPSLLQKIKDLFYREAETLEALGEHPQIPRLLAYFEEKNEFYLVQEYIQGHPLSQELVPGKPLSEDIVIGILIELLEILKFVHSHNVIHRDIKPDNIIRRDEDNRLVLIDFGAVKKLASQGQLSTIVIGTPGYIPPEQARGFPNLSSDIYAIGMLGIEAITGVNLSPEVGGGFSQHPITKEIVWRNQAQVSDELAEILTKMVRMDDQKRYSSAQEALEAIQELQKTPQKTQPATPNTVIQPTGKWQKKASLFLGGIGGIFAVGIGAYFIVNNGVNYPPALLLTGELINGKLDINDIRDPLDNTYTDIYVLSGRKGQEITLEMNSNEFDPSLVILDPNGDRLALNNDISPSNFNARITTTLPQSGKYKVIARSNRAGETGNYTLQAWIK